MGNLDQSVNSPLKSVKEEEDIDEVGVEEAIIAYL